MKQFEIISDPEESAGLTDFRARIIAVYGIPDEHIKAVKLVRRTIDARGRRVKVRMWFDVYFSGEHLPAEAAKIVYRNVGLEKPVFIIGCGPAGMFAALRLIESGFKPVIIEQGKDVRSRRRDLALMNKSGIVNPLSNYCFGEGGAGTYSDGKLFTRSTKRGDVSNILRIFRDHGASDDILIDAHPHIGTNKLPQVITAIRETILAHGGEIHFNSRLDELIIVNGKFRGIKIFSGDNGKESESRLDGQALILATGHSARSIFEMLYRQKIRIQSKPFALGVRIEHPQLIIDAQQYHCDTRSVYLPPASYALTYKGKDRSMYSFCMCPGGIIAPAATEPGEIVVNGWSPSKRNNPFANSGMVVTIDESDYMACKVSGELAALRFQQKIEHLAHQAGGGLLRAPAQRMIDFVDGKLSSSLPLCSYIPGVTSADLTEVLPEFVTRTLRDGFRFFKTKMHDFYTNEAVVVGVESRTSSPVRIPRDTGNLMHPEVSGLFPCGEGAGYAGGIVSAAIDGQLCADQCCKYLS